MVKKIFAGFTMLMVLVAMVGITSFASPIGINPPAKPIPVPAPVKVFKGVGTVQVLMTAYPDVVKLPAPSKGLQFVYQGVTYDLQGNTQELYRYQGKKVEITGYILPAKVYSAVIGVKKPNPQLMVVSFKAMDVVVKPVLPVKPPVFPPINPPVKAR